MIQTFLDYIALGKYVIIIFFKCYLFNTANGENFILLILNSILCSTIILHHFPQYDLWVIKIFLFIARHNVIH